MRNGDIQTLRERYKDEPELLAFYQKKLIEPGWSGPIDNVELAFIKEKLRKSQRLRTKWDFPKGSGRLSNKKILRVAMHGTDGLVSNPH